MQDLLDDEHRCATDRTDDGRFRVVSRGRVVGWRRCFAVQQFACVPKCIASSVIGKQAVMADTVETAWMDFVPRPPLPCPAQRIE